MPSRATLYRRAKKAREVAGAEGYDNVGPHADDIGDRYVRAAAVNATGATIDAAGAEAATAEPEGLGTAGQYSPETPPGAYTRQWH